MKYFSIETAQNNGNVERLGRITFADKYRGQGNGFAYLKCNGRRVYIPYTELDKDTIKSLHVSCPVSFKLATDGKLVWAVDLKVMPHYDRDLRNLYTDLHDWPCEPIKVNSIKKILIVNKYYDLPQNLQIESDNKHIPRKLYEAVQIITIDSEYLIYSKNSPIKGNYHVDNIYDFMEYTLQKLGVGPYEPIENELVSRERVNNEKAFTEDVKTLKESMKNDFIIETRNIISHPSCTKKVFVFSYGSGYTVSCIDKRVPGNQIMSYYNIMAQQDFYELIKKYNGHIEECTLLFNKLGDANGFGKALLMNEVLTRLKEKYNR